MTAQPSPINDVGRAVADSRDCAAFGITARADADAMAAVDKRLLTLSRAALVRSHRHLGVAEPTPIFEEKVELTHLDQANTHIAGAERCIGRQRELIDGLARHGASTVMAERLLATLLVTLAAMERHRAMIRQRLAERQSAPDDALA